MGDALREKYDISNEKIVEFEMLDFGAIRGEIDKNYNYDINNVKIVYAGGLSRGYTGNWISEIAESTRTSFHFYGVDGDWIENLKKKGVEYLGSMPPDKIIEKMNKGYQFGLVNLDVQGYIDYLNYGSSSKFSSYLAAGLPVLCNSKLNYISNLVSKYEVGLVFNNMDDLINRVDAISFKEYCIMRNKAIILGEKLRDGFFFKRAIQTCLGNIQKSHPSLKAN